jgi:hypothetical protein
MILLGLVPILCSGLLGLAAGPLRRRLSPSVAAPLLALAALATSLATGVVLCLAGFLELARNPLVAALGGWSGAGLRPWRLLPATWATGQRPGLPRAGDLRPDPGQPGVRPA